MTSVNAAAAPDPGQVEGGGGEKESYSPPSSPALHGGSKVYKSGPLFLSSKGIGWTSWKKRWFVLTQTSLVFYRSDPNVVPQKGAEANLTLGGIDLNSSGSVVVKEDKKLITVSFADGRDGRAFTLKAETSEDLHEWKVALEEALANAPSATLVPSQNGVLKNDQSTTIDASSEQSKDKQTVKSMVLGRPVLLALEDIDGTPSFLEKALRFIEEHGIRTEGILRQAADVELVERRIQEYEKGKTDFSPDEDAHVIGDCIKYILRELPSSPVPASCCKALIDAYRTDRSNRINALHSAICETFPEPNRRLLQRILMMMIRVASKKAVNRMGVPAVAACMAPLLLRPLLAGECDIDNDVDVGGDSSALLLQAAAAANHAQAIVIILLEEYDNIFGDGALTHEPYTDSEESGSGSDEITDDESFVDDDDDDDYEEYDEDEEYGSGSGSGSDEEEDEHGSSEGSDTGDNRHDKKGSGHGSESVSRSAHSSVHRHTGVEGADNVSNADANKMRSNNSFDSENDPAEASLVQACSELSQGSSRSGRRPTVWGRAAGRKNLSMESIEGPFLEESDSQKLEHVKTDSPTRIPNEAMVKSLLQESMEARKHNLQGRRVDLEKDVARLQEQLQKDTKLRTALDSGLKNSQLSVSSLLDEKAKAELDEIAQLEAGVKNLRKKADSLEFQLSQQRDQISKAGLDLSGRDRWRWKGERMDGKPIYMTSKNQDTAQRVVGAFASNIGSGKPPGSVTRRASTKGGEGPSTSSLSKLANRLNFLKERRTQIANELQSMERGWNTGQNAENPEQGSGSEPSQKAENSDKHQESKAVIGKEHGSRRL